MTPEAACVQSPGQGASIFDVYVSLHFSSVPVGDPIPITISQAIRKGEKKPAFSAHHIKESI